MATIFLIIHLMIAVALVAVILLQRSEGGALGIGGGGGGAFMSGRGAANLLTRTTGILGAAFFATSIILSILASMEAGPSSILDSVPEAETPLEAPAAPAPDEAPAPELPAEPSVPLAD